MNCKICGKPTPVYYKPTGGVRYRLTCSAKCRGVAVAPNRKSNPEKIRHRAAQKAALAALREKNANPFAKRRAYRRDIVREA